MPAAEDLEGTEVPAAAAVAAEGLDQGKEHNLLTSFAVADRGHHPAAACRDVVADH